MRSRLSCVRVAGIVLLVTLVSACVDSATRYREYAEQVALQGGLRSVTAPPDARYDDEDLARNFERIAFFTEYSRKDGVLVQEETASTLSRWEGDLSFSLLGDGVRASDRASFRSLSARLSKLSGRSVTLGTGDEDVSIYIMTEQERAAFRNELASDGNGDRFQILSDWSTQFRYPCVALAGFTSEGSGVIDSGIIVIKAELEGLMRESCIHEELTQVMGLMNDHPDVRPSIFNDDEEFALLTEHDELLLRILYDERLRPAMTLEEARPLIRQIVADMRPGGNT